ncbi:MAG TPA: hypothetical protein VGE47_03190, partial [Burkholderiaceae bacterium]
MKYRSLIPISALICAFAAHADSFKAGIEMKSEASLAAIGLPAYPGAVPRQDSQTDKSAFSFGVWGGMFGLKIEVLKFESSDSFDKISVFYRQALARHGQVLDCSIVPPAPPPAASKAEDKRTLRCDSGDRGPGRQVYKVGP